MSRTRVEIAQQPGAMERFLADAGDAVAPVVAALAECTHIVIAARGTSGNVTRYAQHIFGRLCGLPVVSELTSLHTLYERPPRYGGALVIGISQSGRSPDVIAVLEEARSQGRPTVAITNDPESGLAAAADHVIDIGVGPERAVAATKTYTVSLAAIASIAAAFAGDHVLRRQLRDVPAAMEEQLASSRLSVPEIVPAATGDRWTFVGRGASFCTASEAALKMKELTGLSSDFYSPAELMHGPIGALGENHNFMAIAPDGPTRTGTLEAARAAGERGSAVMIAGRGRGGRDENTIELVPVSEWLSPMVAVIPMQLLAVELSEARGIDTDSPNGLSKVTLTL